MLVVTYNKPSALFILIFNHWTHQVLEDLAVCEII